MAHLQQMLIEHLRDAFSAEKQAIQAMKRSLRRTTTLELRGGA